VGYRGADEQLHLVVGQLDDGIDEIDVIVKIDNEIHDRRNVPKRVLVQAVLTLGERLFLRGAGSTVERRSICHARVRAR
jgi:hypothetical protein